MKRGRRKTTNVTTTIQLLLLKRRRKKHNRYWSRSSTMMTMMMMMMMMMVVIVVVVVMGIAKTERIDNGLTSRVVGGDGGWFMWCCSPLLLWWWMVLLGRIETVLRFIIPSIDWWWLWWLFDEVRMCSSSVSSLSFVLRRCGRDEALGTEGESIPYLLIDDDLSSTRREYADSVWWERYLLNSKNHDKRAVLTFFF